MVTYLKILVCSGIGIDCSASNPNSFERGNILLPKLIQWSYNNLDTSGTKQQRKPE